MVFYPNCKINIGLRVVRKREDGYHDLETIFYPVYGLHDELEVNRVSGIGNQESKSGNQESGVGNRESENGIGSQESGVGNRRLGSGFEELLQFIKTTD